MKKDSRTYVIDETDKQILSFLKDNARLPVKHHRLSRPSQPRTSRFPRQSFHQRGSGSRPQKGILSVYQKSAERGGMQLRYGRFFHACGTVVSHYVRSGFVHQRAAALRQNKNDDRVFHVGGTPRFVYRRAGRRITRNKNNGNRRIISNSTSLFR